MKKSKGEADSEPLGFLEEKLVKKGGIAFLYKLKRNIEMHCFLWRTLNLITVAQKTWACGEVGRGGRGD